MKYAFIHRNRHQWPIRVQCRVLGVSVTGYHEHSRRRHARQGRHLGVRPASVEKFTLAYCTQHHPRTSAGAETTFGTASTGAVRGPIPYDNRPFPTRLYRIDAYRHPVL
jgi:hypothetical protein